MLKIGSDGSGVNVLIFGCPFCDGDKNRNLITYHKHTWYFDYERSLGNIQIRHCPFCGKELPALDEWEVVATHAKDEFSISFREESSECVLGDHEIRCEFCKNIEDKHLGGKYCFNCGRKLHK